MPSKRKQKRSSSRHPRFPPPAPLAANTPIRSPLLPTNEQALIENLAGTPVLDPIEAYSYHADLAEAGSSNINSPSAIPDRGYGRSSKNEMMDPFEVRIRFTQHLQHLNASVTSANKAAQYALKYREMDEDLHSCILEQLEKNTMNNRANIMYFIEHLCDMASREGHPDYVRMMERDILRVVDAVAPEDGSGAANVKVVRKVLAALQRKSYLQAQTVLELEECLKERDEDSESVAGLSSPTSKDTEMMNAGQTPKVAKSNGFQQKFDKKQIEQRIEEDRERHKRLRETIWATPTPTTAPVLGRSLQQAAEDDAEFDKLWDETSDLGEDDFDLYAEEKAERDAASKEWKDEYRKGASGVGE